VLKSGKLVFRSFNGYGKWSVDRHQVDDEGKKRSHDEVMRSYYEFILTENFPDIILALDFHYNLKAKFLQFHRTFLKGKMHTKRAEQWIGREDSVSLVWHKANRILELLKAVDTDRFVDQETHFKCQGFFILLIDFLATQIKAHPSPDLSETEENSFGWWSTDATREFNRCKRDSPDFPWWVVFLELSFFFVF
jgi:hypothetical protein